VRKVKLKKQRAAQARVQRICERDHPLLKASTDRPSFLSALAI